VSMGIRMGGISSRDSSVNILSYCTRSKRLLSYRSE
jgi:hypothetical protein